MASVEALSAELDTNGVVVLPAIISAEQLREMQHAGRPDDHREAECDEAIDAADREATDKELDELRAAHRMFRRSWTIAQ